MTHARHHDRRRLLLLALFVLPGTLRAQWIASAGVTRSMATSAWRAPSSIGTEASHERPAAPKGQIRAGMKGFWIGLGVGAAVGAIAGSAGDDAGGAAFLVALPGTKVGTTVAIHRHGARHGVRSNPILTVVGATLGMLPWPVAPVSSPALATAGYNIFRREGRRP